jgi:hypothetical protein
VSIVLRLPDRVDWLRIALVLSLLAMEAAWVSPWLPLLDELAGVEFRRHSMAGVYVFFLAAFAVTWALRSRLPPSGLRTVLQMGAIVLSMLVLVWAELYTRLPFFSFEWVGEFLQSLAALPRRVPAETPLLAAALYAWYRGATLVGTGILTDVVIIRFRRGFVFVAAYAFLVLVGPRIIPWEVLIFFFFGISSIALARMLESKVRITDWEWGRRWVGLLLGAAAATVMIGSLLLLALGANEFAVGTFLLDLVSQVIAIILGYWATLPGYLINWLMAVLLAFFEGREPPAIELPPPGFGPSVPAAESPIPESLGPVINAVGQVLFLALFILVVVWVARRVGRRSAGPRRLRQPVERVSLESSRGGLGDNLQRVVDAFRRSRLAPRYSTRSVRRIYASMVAYAGELGYVRDEFQTPYEFSPTLLRAFPHAPQEVEQITAAYIRAHYAELPVGKDELAETRASWKRLQAMEIERYGLKGKFREDDDTESPSS